MGWLLKLLPRDDTRDFRSQVIGQSKPHDRAWEQRGADEQSFHRESRGGWGGVGERLKREGTYVNTQLIRFAVQWKWTQQCEAIMLQFKNVGAKNHRFLQALKVPYT